MTLSALSICGSLLPLQLYARPLIGIAMAILDRILPIPNLVFMFLTFTEVFACRQGEIILFVQLLE